MGATTARNQPKPRKGAKPGAIAIPQRIVKPANRARAYPGHHHTGAGSGQQHRINPCGPPSGQQQHRIAAFRQQVRDVRGIVLAVAHDQFKAIGGKAMRGFGKADHVIYDLKNVLDSQESDLRL